MAATYRTLDSCPDQCCFKGNGCYAHGRIFALAKKWGRQEAQVLKGLFYSLRANAKIRHHVSGDITKGNRIDRAYVGLLARLARARPDLQHILYTHAWKQIRRNPFPFVANASCETAEDIKRAVAKGFEAVIVLKDENDPILGTTIAGKKVIRCPEECISGVTCASCMLCSRTRKSIVAFVPHGAGVLKASDAVKERRES
jgi:hypothetical protein